MNEEQNSQSHLIRNITVLFTLIALVIAAVIVLRGADRGSVTASLVNAEQEKVQTVTAAPAFAAPLTKSQETLERQLPPEIPYEDPTAEPKQLAEEINEMDVRLAAEATAQEQTMTPVQEPVPAAAPAPAQQPAPQPAPVPQPAPAPAPAPVISEEAEEFCITDGVTY